VAEEVLVENLPMYLNLGDIGNWHSHVGHAKVFRDVETRRNRIEISLDEETSVALDNMVDAFALKAVGFAGIKRPESEQESQWQISSSS
jgi:hypothetical protein